MAARSLAQTAAGDTIGPVTIVVARETLVAYANASGDQNPIHQDEDFAKSVGLPDVIAPPTFAVTIAQQCDAVFVQDPEAGIDYSRVVHGEQRFVHHRPITAGDSVLGTLTVDTVREAGGHAMVTTRTELATEQGEAVCTATSTIVIRGGE